MAKYGVKKSGDPKTKYGKYIVYSTYDNPFHPSNDPDTDSMYLDSRSVEGGFYFSGGVGGGKKMPTPAPDKPAPVPWKPHSHDYWEYIILWGTNPADPSDLCGEVEFYLGDEKHTVTTSCVITVPPGIFH